MMCILPMYHCSPGENSDLDTATQMHFLPMIMHSVYTTSLHTYKLQDTAYYEMIVLHSMQGHVNDHMTGITLTVPRHRCQAEGKQV